MEEKSEGVRLVSSNINHTKRMCNQIHCPRCFSANVKNNGLFCSKKQSHKCKACGKKFSDDGNQWVILKEKQAYIKGLLLERLSLRGICRVMGALNWLLVFIKGLYAQLPEDLHSKVKLRG